MRKWRLRNRTVKRAWFTFVFVALAIFVWVVSSKSELQRMIENSPETQDGGFRSARLVATVNALRAVGKEKALEELHRYAAGEGRWANGRVWMMTVCLFPNKGNRRAGLGVPGPNMTEEAMDKPTFPLVFSRGVPFLVVQGYAVFGMLGPATKIVDECRGEVMVGADLPVTGHLEAAKALVESAEFKAMFVEPRDADRMAAYVLEQAE